MKKLLFLFALIAMVASTMAQDNMGDVVYLKNGGITKGIIIEQVPFESLKIQTADGCVFVYQMNEIEKITKEAIQQNSVTVTPAAPVSTTVSKSNTTSDLLERNGTDICYMYGRSLSDNEILNLVGQDRFDTYRGGRSQLRTGRTFATIGWIAFGTAIISGVATEDEEIAFIVAIPADFFLPLGFIFKGIGKGRINWVCDDYNSSIRSNNFSLNFTPTLMSANIPGQNSAVAFGASLSLSF